MSAISCGVVAHVLTRVCFWQCRPHLGKPRFVFNQALVHISVLEKQKRTEYRPMPKLDTKNVQYVEN